MRGLEPPTSASQTLRASHLRYTPRPKYSKASLRQSSQHPMRQGLHLRQDKGAGELTNQAVTEDYSVRRAAAFSLSSLYFSVTVR